MSVLNNEFARIRLTTPAFGSVDFFSLELLEQETKASLHLLPYTLRVLLESVLRNLGQKAFSPEHLEEILNWSAQSNSKKEIPFKPARVLLQDFTGVPVLVDLAAMRESVARLGKSALCVNPLVRCDLVIDHSIQVDYFGRSDACQLNERLEFERNRERYRFLKWGQRSFKNLNVVPPASGICHQVNLEFLSEGVYFDRERNVVYPDSCVGTDSHTPTVNGLGVLGWGVGGIEAEAVMLDQPLGLALPEVIGIKLKGTLREGVTATDLVLGITEICRQAKVVGSFVEFFGDGVDALTVADRATVSNMAPEQGCTVSYFPPDQQTLEYLRSTGRPQEIVDLAERYLKEQGLFRSNEGSDPEYSREIEVDLETIEPALAGPKRPHDRIALSGLAAEQQRLFTAALPQGYGLDAKRVQEKAEVTVNEQQAELHHGSVVLAAITSCTNTSNPSLMIAAGLLAKNAVERGLKTKCYVKTSFAPGSVVVKDYLAQSGLLPYLEELGFQIVGYGCMTCIGNSGPLPEAVARCIREKDLLVSAVLSGNRNFEGRVHPLTRANYLASPPLVVAYALFGTTAADITTLPLGNDRLGNAVYLRDIWPTNEDVDRFRKRFVKAEMYLAQSHSIFTGPPAWRDIEVSDSEFYLWQDLSTYIKRPPFAESQPVAASKLVNMRVLGMFGDSITTDHISPAGTIAEQSPAGRYLKERGVRVEEFNSYGSRRGNHEVMMRGTFANSRLRNLLVPEAEGNVTIDHLSGTQMTFFEAAKKYQAEGTYLLIIAGKDYGSGSSRDWAAKGPYLLGVRTVIAESFERIHRSNLIGMGILPLEFLPGENVGSIGLDGTEEFSLCCEDGLRPRQRIVVRVQHSRGTVLQFETLCRIDTEFELMYYANGGILPTVLRELATN